MKRHVVLSIGLATALVTLFSCTSDWGQEESPVAIGNEVQEVQALMPVFETGDAETKLDMNIHGNSITLAWSEEDKIGVFPETGDQINFAMSKGAGGSTATFSGGGWALKNNAIYYAYYPFNRECYAGEEMKNQVPCSFEGQVQTGENSLKHLGKYAYMYSSGSTPAEGKVTLSLQHLTTLLKLDLLLDVEPITTIKSVTLEVPGDEKAFCLEGTIDLMKGILTPTKTSSSMILSCAGDIQLTTSGTSVYLLLPPTDMSGKQVQISVDTEEHGIMYASFVPSQAWKAGRFYVKQLSFSHAYIPDLPSISITSEVKEVGSDDNIGYGVKYYDITYTALVRGTGVSFDYFLIKNKCLALSEIDGVEEDEQSVMDESETKESGEYVSSDGNEQKITYTLKGICIPNSYPYTRMGGYNIKSTYTRTITTSAIASFSDGQESICCSNEISNQWTWFDMMIDVLPDPGPGEGEEL